MALGGDLGRSAGDRRTSAEPDLVSCIHQAQPCLRESASICWTHAVSSFQLRGPRRAMPGKCLPEGRRRSVPVIPMRHVNAVRSPQGRHAFSGQYLCIGSLAAVVLVTAAAAATSYSPVIAAMMAAIAAAVGIGAAILVLRSWQLRCDVSSDSLTVRNPLRSISFRWEDISGVTVESAGPLGPKSAGAIRCLSFGLPDGRVKAVATNNLDLRLAPSIRLVTELHRHQVPVDWEARRVQPVIATAAW